MMDGFDTLGAEMPPKSKTLLARSTLAVAVGAIGAMLFPKHRVLGFLNGAALASNLHAVGVKERSWQDAARRLGKHVVASAGSLALPSHPVVGYIAGAVAGDLFLDGNGGGIIEEIRDHAKQVAPKKDVVDAELVEDKTTTALTRAS